MKAIALKNNVRVTPRKSRLVVDLVRGQDVNQAIAILTNTPKAASREVLKLVKSAAANAVHNFRMREDDLFISEIQVGDGQTLKRYSPRAKGASSKILKRTSNIRVVVEERGS